MRHRGELLLAAVLMLCACQMLAAGPKMIEMNAPSPTAVVKEFYKAIWANDPAGAKACAAGDPANQFIAVMTTRMTQSMKRITTAWADRYGEVVVIQNMPFNLRYPDMSALDKATEKITGETAVVTVYPLKGMPPWPVPLRRENGFWKIDGNATARIRVDQPELVNSIEQILAAMDAEAAAVAADVTAGKFAKWADVVTTCTARMDAAKLKKIEEIAEDRRRRGVR